MSGRCRVLTGVLFVWMVAAAPVSARAWLEGAPGGADGRLSAVSAQVAPQADSVRMAGGRGRSGQVAGNGVSGAALFAALLAPRLQAGTRGVPVPAAVRRGEAPVFVETEVDDLQPYVQQRVAVTVRLYFALQLVSGELTLAPPASASLQRVGEERRSVRDIGGRSYHVLERRFVLIPERSGPLRLEGAGFNGRGVGGFFDGMFGTGGRALEAHAPAQVLQVRAMPAAAPQPWLPLTDLRLRYTGTVRHARVGEAVTLEVEASAAGATRAQFPELPLPAAGPAAQVLAEPARYDETFGVDGPRLTVTRRYALVPRQAGALTLPGPHLAWWDVRSATARTARLPDLVLDVAAAPAGMPGTAAAPVPAARAPLATDDRPPAAVAARAASRSWPMLAAGFAMLWLATLLWALLRRHPSPDARTAPRTRVPAAPGATHTLADLRRALDLGDLDDIEQALRGMARPPARDLDALAAGLGDTRQQAALEALRRARWAGGAAPQARAALRSAFGAGPAWRVESKAAAAPLPPLYPPR
ncbi:protein BatD [Stenotrophomonas mori]|uniref:Protein BatD n=1 Tax=Stenotrophomonas mori TaxID=2871096 RepID=A0ABT0SCS8_9GAMM|nr:protein BatD [Stenotrophomonas mori]MCL7713124.1 protein BatD [Stenotrophomonas mori]